jgi:hypothetical protein
MQHGGSLKSSLHHFTKVFYMNRITRILCASSFALAVVPALAQSGGSGGGGGGPGLNSSDSVATQPKNGGTSATTQPSATSQGNSMSGGNLNPQGKASNQKARPGTNSSMGSKAGENPNTQTTGQGRTISPQ